MTVHLFGSFVCQPKSPSSGHTAFLACFGKCRSSTSHCSWGSDGTRGTARPPLSSPAGIHRGPREGGRGRSIVQPRGHRQFHQHGCPNGLFLPSVPGPGVETEVSTRSRFQGTEGFSHKPHRKGILLPFTDRETEAHNG